MVILLLTFAAVVDFRIVCLVIAVESEIGWIVNQVDFSNAFC